MNMNGERAPDGLEQCQTGGYDNGDSARTGAGA